MSGHITLVIIVQQGYLTELGLILCTVGRSVGEELNFHILKVICAEMGHTTFLVKGGALYELISTFLMLIPSWYRVSSG